VDFFPEEWCESTYGQHPPVDVDGLATVHGLNLTSQFVIRFQQRGSGGFNSDGMFLDEVNVYDPELEYSQLPFNDNFDDGGFKKAWAWNFADATAATMTGGAITNPMSVVGIDLQSGLNGSPGVVIGKRCNGAFTTNALDLHLNLAGESDVELAFWIADYYDENHIDDGLYFSDDGGVNFEKVLDFFPEEWCESTYGQHPPVDVDDLAAAYELNLTSQFVIRFQQRGSGGFNSDGMFLDEVSVYDPEVEYANLPFSDTFESGSFGKSWSWSFADSSTSVISEDAITNPMSVVVVDDEFGHNGSTYGVVMGKRCGGTFTTNALDLHLNLSGQQEVQLSFWIAHYYEEYQIDDGVYFSDDGGITFQKVYDLDFSGVNNLTYSLYELDVDVLASTNELELTNTFVIRFQQRGQGSFNSDGFYLDDVNVGGVPTASAEVSNVNEFSVFPNPATTTLYYNTEGLGKKVKQVEIADKLGNIILRRNANPGQSVDIEGLPQGVYFFSLVLDNGKRSTNKFVRQ